MAKVITGVEKINADTVDGKHASEFLGVNSTAIGLRGLDTRSVNYTPADYMMNGSMYLGIASMRSEFKGTATIGVNSVIGGTYCQLITYMKCDDSSAGYPTQMAIGADGVFLTRSGTSLTTWSAWLNPLNSWNTGRSVWNSTGVIHSTVGQLAWKNYGNGHTIIDASGGTAPNGAVISNATSQIPWQETFPTLVGWNGSGTYGVRVDSSRISDSSKTSFLHSSRNFPNGTLITTSINYAVEFGDPWVLEIKGNSYSRVIPLDIQVQGYIYANTIIQVGGYSNGSNISDMVALNVGGNLCFWFPSQSYWEGYNVNVYTANSGYVENRVLSISATSKPTGTKEVAISTSIRQSWHSGNTIVDANGFIKRV